MKTIEMTKDFKVAPDGVNVALWQAGAVVTTYDQLADDLVNDAKVAKYTKEATDTVVTDALAPEPVVVKVAS